MAAQIKQLEERIEALLERKRTLQAKERKAARKRRDRRRYLVGAALLDLAKESDAQRDQVQRLMDRFLTRAADRELFDLPPVDPTP